MKTKRITWAVALLVLTMMLCAFGGFAGAEEERAEWKALLEQKDYAGAMQMMQEAAKDGDAEAMAGIGHLYMQGAGVERNREEAMEWYRRALENGSTTAYIYMGEAYEEGKTVEKDLDAALEWYMKAWEEGTRENRQDSAESIACLYEQDGWEKKDHAAAWEWGEKAEAEGKPDVWAALGRTARDNTEEGHYEQAQKYYGRGLEAGSQLTKYYLGFAYIYGYGVEINYARAKELFEEAFDDGFAEAGEGLAKMYMYGYGVDVDGEKAIEYATKALEGKQGIASRAMIDIAIVYEDGIGVDKDIEKAIEWHLKSSENGASPAGYNNVGMKYFYGDGVKQDYAEAVKWFEKAAAGDATHWLGLCYYEGKGVKRDFRKAMELFLKDLDSGVVSARTGSNMSIEYIADMYAKGQSVKQDLAEALAWYERGADDGDPDCMRKAAAMYREGKGTEINTVRAGELIERAGLLDGASSYSTLGDMYLNGDSVAKDYAQAIAFFEKGAEMGSVYCHSQLGWIYSYAKGYEHDYAKALEYFRKGAEMGSPYCYERIGFLYDEGKGLEKDPEKAVEYFRIAVEKAIEQDNSVTLNRCMKALKRLGRVASGIGIQEKQTVLLVGAGKEKAEAKLHATVSPEEVYWKDLTWSSSREDVATVDQDGTVHAISAGRTNITAVVQQPDSEVKPAQVQVQVTVSQAVESIALDAEEVSIPIRKSIPVRAAVSPANAANKQVEWTSENEEIASVNRGGQITGKGVGTTTVTATAADGSGVAARVRVTVVQPVTKIETKDKNIVLAESTSWQTEVNVLPEEATDRTLAWASGDEKVAAADEDGKIRAVGAGACTVTGSAQDGSGMKVQIRVTVKAFDVVLAAEEAEGDGTELFGGAVKVSGGRMTGDFDPEKVKFRNGCAALENGILVPLKAGEDTVTVSYTADGKQKQGNFTLYVPQDAAAD